MPSIYPAMKAQLGTTSYYIFSMKAKELTEKVKPLQEQETEDLKDMTIEERYQRKLNYNRVRRQIAPYFANNDDRFCGAVIVSAHNFKEEEAFEPLSDLQDIPKLYEAAARTMGFLIFRGGEVLAPLDGQHRLKALQFAITGKDEKDKDIQEIEPCIKLADEDITVILVPYEKEIARKIFTRVNRYAKKTTAGENYITDDDDIIAVLARTISNDVIHESRLVKDKGNTLTSKDEFFTTLTNIYNCNKYFLEHKFPKKKIDTEKLPDKSTQELYKKRLTSFWTVLLSKIEVFSDLLIDPKNEEKGDDNRREIRKSNLLGKPVGQECLMRAFVRLTLPPTNFSPEEACNELNSLPWELSKDNLKVWDRVLWTGGTDDGKILTKKRELATRIIAYLSGEKLNDEQKDELLKDYRILFPEDERMGKQLPTMP